MNQEFLNDKYPSIEFEIACFENYEELLTKPLMGLDGTPVDEDNIIIKNPNFCKETHQTISYEYYIIPKYAFREHITYTNVLDFLEDKLTETEGDRLKDIVEEKTARTPHSLRVFNLVWENK
jgi:hypothetical protein